MEREPGIMSQKKFQGSVYIMDRGEGPADEKCKLEESSWRRTILLRIPSADVRPSLNRIFNIDDDDDNDDEQVRRRSKTHRYRGERVELV